jgi:large subunit ribosomal protein L21
VGARREERRGGVTRDLDLAEKTAEVEILEHLRGDKIHVYKYKPKKDHRKKTGHRQELTRVKVLEVSDGS